MSWFQGWLGHGHVLRSLHIDGTSGEAGDKTRAGDDCVNVLVDSREREAFDVEVIEPSELDGSLGEDSFWIGSDTVGVNCVDVGDKPSLGRPLSRDSITDSSCGEAITINFLGLGSFSEEGLEGDFSSICGRAFGGDSF